MTFGKVHILVETTQNRIQSQMKYVNSNLNILKKLKQTLQGIIMNSNLYLHMLYSYEILI